MDFLGFWICYSTRKELSHDTKLSLTAFFWAKNFNYLTTSSMSLYFTEW